MGDDNVPAQAQALANTAGARFRDDLEVRLLTGDDQRSWLNGQVTNDVRNTGAGDAVYCLAVTVKGRIMADLWVLDRGDQLCLALPRDASEQVLASFDRQIIMDDVEIDESDEVVLSIQGPRSAEVLAMLPEALRGHAFTASELGSPGHFVLVPASGRAATEAALAQALGAVSGMRVTESGFELARLRAGRPRFGRDFGMKTYPQEVGLKERAVSFNKGCYLGQEVICTLESRGRLARKLCALSADGALAADSPLVTDAGDEVGRVTSSMHDAAQQRWLALGLVKQAHASKDTRLVSDAGGVSVLGPVESL